MVLFYFSFFLEKYSIILNNLKNEFIFVQIRVFGVWGFFTSTYEFSELSSENNSNLNFIIIFDFDKLQKLHEKFNLFENHQTQ